MNSVISKNPTVATRVKTILHEKLGVEESAMSDNASFSNDLGLDSLDVLETFMLKFTDMAEKESNPAKFERYARFAVHCAQSLAPYQSPTLRAIMVASQPEKNDTTTTTIRLKIFDHNGNELKDSSSGLSDRPDFSDDIEACKIYRRLVSGGN